MEAGKPHIDYGCPGCGKRFRSVAEHAGRNARCPDCGATFTIPSSVPAPGTGQPPRSRYADRFGGPQQGDPAEHAPGLPPSGGPAEPPRWPNNWAITWGIALLFAVLMPQPIETREYRGGYGSDRVEEIEWLFAWDAIDRVSDRDDARAKLVIGLLATVGLGLFAIIGGAAIRGRALGHSLFWASVGTFLLSFLLIRTWEGLIGRLPDEATGAVIVAIAMLFATAVIAAGNHVRKFRPFAGAPRHLAGIGGIVLVVGMLLPVFDEHMMIEGLLEEDPWEEVPALMACCVALVIFAVLSLWSYLPGAIRALNQTLSILMRCIMIAFPVILLITIMSKNRDPNFGMVFIAVLKGFLQLYAPLAIVAVGVASMAGSGEVREKRLQPYA